jgi:hypothetical protein
MSPVGGVFNDGARFGAGVEWQNVLGGASHGYTSALSVEATAAQQVPVPAAPARLGMECLAADFLPEKVRVRRIGEAVNQVPLVLVE